MKFRNLLESLEDTISKAIYEDLKKSDKQSSVFYYDNKLLEEDSDAVKEIKVKTEKILYFTKEVKTSVKKYNFKFLD